MSGNKIDTFSEDGKGIYDPRLDGLTNRVRHGKDAVASILPSDTEQPAKKPFDPNNTDTWPGREFIEKAH